MPDGQTVLICAFVFTCSMKLALLGTCWVLGKGSSWKSRALPWLLFRRSPKSLFLRCFILACFPEPVVKLKPPKMSCQGFPALFVTLLHKQNLPSVLIGIVQCLALSIHEPGTRCSWSKLLRAQLNVWGLQIHIVLIT